MLEEDYCSFEVAKLLKENGFDTFKSYGWDEELFDKEHPRNFSLGFDNKEHWISCPTHQMAMKWLREVYKLHIGIARGPKGYHITIETIPLGVVKYITREIVGTTYVDSYEEAVEAALKYSLENLI